MLVKTLKCYGRAMPHGLKTHLWDDASRRHTIFLINSAKYGSGTGKINDKIVNDKTSS